jgi:hypothetical protein
MHIRYRAAAFAVAVVGLVGGGMTAASATGDHKTSICHRTASDTNPYVFETVDNHALQAHLSNGKGHFPKQWKSAGTWRGVAHVAGDPKNDYLATSAADCQDTQSEDGPTVVVPVLPAATEADCDTDGQLVISAQPEHVTVDPVAGTYGPGDYTVTFTTTNDGDSDHDDFVFANGESTMAVQVHVDAATGGCPTPGPKPKPKPHHPSHHSPRPHTTPNAPVPVVVEAGL